MQITFDPFNPHERNVVNAVLSKVSAGGSAPAAEPAVAYNTGSVASESLASSEGGAGGYAGEATAASIGADASPAPETAPKKRGRKPKSETAPEPEAPEPGAVVHGALQYHGALTGRWESETAPEPEPEATDNNPPTIDDVRGALQEYTVRHGVPAGVALVKEFGAERVGEINPGDYHAFVKRCAE